MTKEKYTPNYNTLLECGHYCTAWGCSVGMKICCYECSPHQMQKVKAQKGQKGWIPQIMKREMESNMELDELFAKKVMGWTIDEDKKCTSWVGTEGYVVENLDSYFPTRNRELAMDGLDKLEEKGYYWRMSRRTLYRVLIYKNNGFLASASDSVLSKAIVMACLRAVG